MHARRRAGRNDFVSRSLDVRHHVGRPNRERADDHRLHVVTAGKQFKSGVYDEVRSLEGGQLADTEDRSPLTRQRDDVCVGVGRNESLRHRVFDDCDLVGRHPDCTQLSLTELRVCDELRDQWRQEPAPEQRIELPRVGVIADPEHHRDSS